MSTSEDKWFEVWWLQGVDVPPSCLYIVTPSPDDRQRVIVLDPQKGNAIVFDGKNYEETHEWLCEDEFSLINGRMFPDDGW